MVLALSLVRYHLTVIYFCWKLTEVQTRWATIEWEVYAVIFALENFGCIVFNPPIIIYCDQNPLTYLVKCASKSTKLMRWSLNLAKWDITIRHISGVDIVSADCLSRLVTH